MANELQSFVPICSIITALGTILISFLAYKISAKQYAIDKFKKEDFLYERRLDFYLRVNDIIHRIANSFLQKEFSMPTGIYPEINNLCNICVFLFGKNEIYQELKNIDEYCFKLYGLHGPLNSEDREKTMLYFINLKNSDKLLILFSPYLKLAS